MISTVQTAVNRARANAVRTTALGLIGVCTAAAMPSSAAAISGKQPLAVVLCNFTDKTGTPDVNSLKDEFSETGAGKQGVFDYWKDISYGKLDLTGTVVKGWYTVPKTVAEWNALSRGAKVELCASQAKDDIDFAKFTGVVAVTNQTGQSEDLFGGVATPTEKLKIGGIEYDSLGYMVTEADQQSTASCTRPRTASA